MTGIDDRRGRRRRLLWASAPVVLIVALVALVALKAISMPLINDHGIDAFDRGDSASATDSFDALAFGNVVQRHIAPFNLGDARFVAHDFDGARAQFERALDLASADDRCRVLVNLVMTVEALGDERAESDDPDGARALHTEALGMIEESDCPIDNIDGSGERLDEARDRLADKISGSDGDGEDGSDGDGEDGSDASDEGDGDEAPASDEPSRSQLEELAERSREGAAQQRRSDTGRGSGEEEYTRDPGGAYW
ncbi:MAG TPA: hypothetical protein VIP77_03640 [Jiangellaceae bacterium]